MTTAGQSFDGESIALYEPPARFMREPPPPPPAPPTLRELPATGTLQFLSDPRGAEVFVDGDYRAASPTAELALPAGSYKVVLKKRGYKTWEQTVMVTPGLSTPIMANLEVEAYDPRKPRIVGLDPN